MTAMQPRAERQTSAGSKWRVSRGAMRIHLFFAFYLLVAFSSPTVSIAFTAILALVGIVLRLLSLQQNPKITWTEVLITASVIYMLVAAAMSWQYRASFTSFAAEAKLPLLLLAALAISQLRGLFTFSGNARAISTSLLLINATYFAASGGAFRYIDTLDSGSVISIYMSIILAVLFLLDQSIIRRIAIVVFMIWLGSSTGLVALAAGVVTGVAQRNGRLSAFRVLVALVLSVIFLALIYWYTLGYRGRDLLVFASVDRFQLFSAGLRYITDTITLRSLLFGYGTGTELVGIFSYFASDASVLPWLENSRASEGFTGLVFHNEFLRVFVNFGVVGSILLWLAVFRLVRKPELQAVLVVASLLNSTVYSNSVFFFILIAEVIYQIRSDRPGRGIQWRSQL